MRVLGVVTELNPFHLGHAVFLEEARRRTAADWCICVMSGDFVQRGEPAILEKRIRTRCALESGADLVLELPPCFSTASSEGFAFGGMAMLAATGVVTDIAFGSEIPDARLLARVARLLSAEPPVFREKLTALLKDGLPYPAARQEALRAVSDHPEDSDVLSFPNAALGVDYLRAQQKLLPDADLCIVPREGTASHGDPVLTDSALTSAASLRSALSGQDGSIEAWAPHVPASLMPLYRDAFGKHFPLFADDFSLLLEERLLFADPEDWSAFAGIDPELAARMHRLRSSFTTFSAFADLLRDKSRTRSSVSRALIHLLCGIRNTDIPQVRTDGAKAFLPPYLYMLGFRREAGPLLHAIGKKSSCPLTAGKKESASLPEKAARRLEKDISASLLWQMVCTQKYRQPFVHEWTRQPVIL